MDPDSNTTASEATKQPTNTKSSLVVLAVIALIALGAAAYFGWSWMQQKDEIAEKQSQIETLEAMSISEAEAEAQLPATTNELVAVYNKILEQSIAHDESEDAAILEAAKEYYELDTLPTGVTVLAVYQVTKPDTKPSGDLYALVYWPASDSKPAGFIDMIKTIQADEWKFNVQI